MPRVKPTVETDVIGNLNRASLDAFEDFFESIQQNKNFAKLPGNAPEESFYDVYIQNKREYATMLELQKEVIQILQKQKKLNKARIQNVYKNQAELRKRFIEVNNFLKDCSSKIIQAETQIADQTTLQNKYSREIASNKKDIEILSDFLVNLKNTVQQLEPYQSIMNDTIQELGNNVTVETFVNSCDALMMTKVNIDRMHAKKFQEIEDMRHQMIKITNEGALTILGLKNELIQLLRTYNEARHHCNTWEKIFQNAKDKVTERSLDMNLVNEGINQIYIMLCLRTKREPIFQRVQINNQLEYIRAEVQVLRNVLNLLETNSIEEIEKIIEIKYV